VELCGPHVALSPAMLRSSNAQAQVQRNIEAEEEDQRYEYGSEEHAAGAELLLSSARNAEAGKIVDGEYVLHVRRNEASLWEEEADEVAPNNIFSAEDEGYRGVYYFNEETEESQAAPPAEGVRTMVGGEAGIIATRLFGEGGLMQGCADSALIAITDGPKSAFLATKGGAAWSFRSTAEVECANPIGAGDTCVPALAALAAARADVSSAQVRRCATGVTARRPPPSRGLRTGAGGRLCLVRLAAGGALHTGGVRTGEGRDSLRPAALDTKLR